MVASLSEEKKWCTHKARIMDQGLTRDTIGVLKSIPLSGEMVSWNGDARYDRGIERYTSFFSENGCC